RGWAVDVGWGVVEARGRRAGAFPPPYVGEDRRGGRCRKGASMNDGPIRVYKVGGPALEDPALIGALADEVRGGRGPAALVHGGGRRVGRLLRALAIESRFVNGRRETSPAAMEVVEMVLSGVVNKALAAGLTGAGVPALGLSGRDAGLIRARLEPDLGRVGTPERVDPAAAGSLWKGGLLPVISPGSSGPTGDPVSVNGCAAALGPG